MVLHLTRSRALLRCGGFLALAASAPALAQSDNYAQDLLNNEFTMGLGGFVGGTDVEGELDGSAGQNQEIDFGKNFGLDNDATRIRLDGLWRITPTHHLRFLYFDTQNDGSRTLARTINWGDYTFAVGSRVDAEVRVQIAELTHE